MTAIGLYLSGVFEDQKSCFEQNGEELSQRLIRENPARPDGSLTIS